MTSRPHDSGWRRGFRWLYLLTALLVVLGVLRRRSRSPRTRAAPVLTRWAAPDRRIHDPQRRDHRVPRALVGYWGSWKRIGFAFLLP
jgi:hypothetical protein